MRASHTITPLFDDPNLVGSADLVPALRLAESAGLYDLLAQHLSVESPNRVAKAGCVVAGMLAGADSIDDLDVLRHGAMGRLSSVESGHRRRWGPICGPLPALGTTHGWVRRAEIVLTRSNHRRTSVEPRVALPSQHN